MESDLAEPMADTVYIIQTTLSGGLNEAEVGYWAQSIIDTKLAGCINSRKITSIFRWQGEIQSKPEWQVQIKTTKKSKDELISKIKSEHSYDNQEILCWPTDSTKEYSDWIKGD